MAEEKAEEANYHGPDLEFRVRIVAAASSIEIHAQAACPDDIARSQADALQGEKEEQPSVLMPRRIPMLACSPPSRHQSYRQVFQNLLDPHKAEVENAFAFGSGPTERSVRGSQMFELEACMEV